MGTVPRKYFLAATAVSEAGIGLLLLAAPAAPLRLLFGIDAVGPETASISRIAGAALLAIGVACWLARNDDRSAAQAGLLAGALMYDVAAAAILAYAGLALNLTGVALWPGVAFHVAMTAWCVACLRR